MGFFFFKNCDVQDIYGICPQIFYTKISDKIAYANSANPDQEHSDQGLHCLPFYYFTEYFKKQLHKKQNLG